MEVVEYPRLDDKISLSMLKSQASSLLEVLDLRWQNLKYERSSNLKRHLGIFILGTETGHTSLKISSDPKCEGAQV